MGRLFGTDGVRGIAGQTLTVSMATALGAALAAVLGEGKKSRPTVVVGRDTRLSGPMLQAAVTAGLLSRGADVTDLGILPTPAVAYLTKLYQADAGVMISASHNPAPYNGIKLFEPRGQKLPDLLEQRLERIALGEETLPPAPIGDAIGRYHTEATAGQAYIGFLASTVSAPLRGMRVAVDCANGSASVTAERLFSSLGIEAEILFGTPDGMNINRGCGSTDMEALSAYVREHRLCCGIAFDGDADRCLMVDETGEIVDGDSLLAICAADQAAGGELRENTVVGTVMTNYGFRKFCEARGIRFLATPVGDRYVREEMDRCGAVLGGESSGHLIFGDKASTGDGQLTALEVLGVMARSGASLASLGGIMKRYPQYTDAVPVTERGKARFYTDERIRAAEEKAGTRLAGRGRILVRPSGTEPLIRVMAEGEDECEIRAIVRELVECITACLSERGE